MTYPINKEKERQQKNALLSLLFEYKKSVPISPMTAVFNESILEVRASHSYSSKAAELGRMDTCLEMREDDELSHYRIIQFCFSAKQKEKDNRMIACLISYTFFE